MTALIELADDLCLPLEVVTETVAVLANRGSGKSATARRLVEQMHRAGLPVVVLDVKGDWWGIRSSADGLGPGLPFVIFGGEHADVPLEATAGDLLADMIVDDRVPAILDMSSMSKTQARSFATAFAERLYRRNRDPLHVVIEEADVLVPQRASADTARLLGAMEDLAKRGRSRGIGLTLCSQRGQEVSKSVLELMETVVLLRMTGPRTIKAAQDWIRVNADDDTQARAVIASLPELHVGEAWVWSPAFLRLLKRVRITMFDTFDSHATPRPGQARVVPKTRADIDLEQLGAEIVATARRARDNDPKALRDRVSGLQAELSAVDVRAGELAGRVAEVEALLAARDATIAQLERRVREWERPEAVIRTLTAAAEMISGAATTLASAAVPESTTTPSAPQRPELAAQEVPPGPPVAVERQPRQRSRVGGEQSSAPRFRSGAQRMLEALGQLAPLRLTKSQWGTVSRMKHSGGTFNTYKGELLRAGLIDEDSVGFTLTAAGFDYLGRRVEPMTGEELQQHFLAILRKGEARMLTALIKAHPAGLSKEEIAVKSEIAVTGGTFNTYLGVLVRNKLIERRADRYYLSAMLEYGAAAT